MKRCLQCRSTYDGPEWTCPACGASPARVDGFVAFAPDLAASNDGMEPDAHHRLDRLQDSSFWFRVRNRLVKDLVRRYFPAAERVLEIGCGTGYVLRALQSASDGTAARRLPPNVRGGWLGRALGPTRAPRHAAPAPRGRRRRGLEAGSPVAQPEGPAAHHGEDRGSPAPASAR